MLMLQRFVLTILEGEMSIWAWFFLAAYLICGTVAAIKFLIWYYRDEPSSVKLTFKDLLFVAIVSPLVVTLWPAGLIANAEMWLEKRYPQAKVVIVASSSAFTVLALFIIGSTVFQASFKRWEFLIWPMIAWIIVFIGESRKSRRKESQTHSNI
jgi:hypothetical protein